MKCETSDIVKADLPMTTVLKRSPPYQGGADLNTADEESLTPLHMAARWVVVVGSILLIVHATSKSNLYMERLGRW